MIYNGNDDDGIMAMIIMICDHDGYMSMLVVIMIVVIMKG